MTDKIVEEGDLALRSDLEEVHFVEVKAEVAGQAVEVKVVVHLEEDVAFLLQDENPEEASPQIDAAEIFPDHAPHTVPEDLCRLVAEDSGVEDAIDLVPQLIDLPDNETDHTRAHPHLAQVLATRLLHALDLPLRDPLDPPPPQDLEALGEEEEIPVAE
jgi:hypothetical protein